MGYYGGKHRIKAAWRSRLCLCTCLRACVLANLGSEAVPESPKVRDPGP